MSAGETFYGRHTAQHPAAVIVNNNKSLDPLRAKKTFIRKKLGQTAVSGYSSLISDPLNLAKGARRKTVNLQILTWQSSQSLL